MQSAQLFVSYGAWLRRLAAPLVAGLMVLWSAPVTANQSSPAPDLEREQRLKDQIVDGILDGEPVMLTGADAHEFLAIYTEAEEEAKGTVIVMHGRGMHPDWSDVVGPIRVGLTEHGWNTLSIQMPVLEKGRKYFDYVSIFPASYPRIEAAIAYAREQGAEKVVALAHSCSVHMSMAYVRDKGHARFDAYIGVGMGATDYGQPMREPFPLANMTLPVLDIFGADEYHSVKKDAPARKASLTANNPNSRQVVVKEAEHYFKDKGDELTDAVAAWLADIIWE